MKTLELIDAMRQVKAKLGRNAAVTNPLITRMGQEVAKAIGFWKAAAFVPAIHKADNNQPEDLAALLKESPEVKAIMKRYLPLLEKDAAAKPQDGKRKPMPTLDEQKRAAVARAEHFKALAKRDAEQAAAQEKDARRKAQKDGAADGKQEDLGDANPQLEQQGPQVNVEEFTRATEAHIAALNRDNGTDWKLVNTDAGFDLVNGQSKVQYNFKHGFHAIANPNDKEAVQMLIESTIANDKMNKAKEGYKEGKGLTINCTDRAVAEEVYRQFQAAGVKVHNVVVKADGKSADITEELAGAEQDRRRKFKRK